MGREDLAARLRRKLLARMEKMVDEFPEGIVTETRSQQDEVTRLFKLRDLTAAYKDLAGGAAQGASPGGDVEDLGPLARMLNES